MYHSKLELFPGKLHSHWVGPFVITNVFHRGAVKIKIPRIGMVFKVNGHRLKPFYEGFQVQNIDLVDLEDPSYSS